MTNHVADLLTWERPDDATLASIGASKLSSYPADWPVLESLSAPVSLPTAIFETGTCSHTFAFLRSSQGVVGDFANLLAENSKAGSDGSRYATILFGMLMPECDSRITLRTMLIRRVVLLTQP